MMIEVNCSIVIQWTQIKKTELGLAYLDFLIIRFGTSQKEKLTAFWFLHENKMTYLIEKD